MPTIHEMFTDRPADIAIPGKGIARSPTVLIHKQLQTYAGILSAVATDTLVLKHQAISMPNTDYLFIV